jgi:predicted phage tail protein
MGLKVDGTVITTTERFPITASFNTSYELSFARLDFMRITPATASVPSAPANLTVTVGSATATLRWTASKGGHPISYKIYCGPISDGEANTPIATVSGTTTTFTDTGLQNGTTYFYYVAASNRVGISPDSNEVSVTPG